jgi:hypothetical protein
MKTLFISKLATKTTSYLKSLKLLNSHKYSQSYVEKKKPAEHTMSKV